jgi:hypothetical protein
MGAYPKGAIGNACGTLEIRLGSVRSGVEEFVEIELGLRGAILSHRINAENIILVAGHQHSFVWQAHCRGTIANAGMAKDSGAENGKAGQQRGEPEGMDHAP